MRNAGGPPWRRRRWVAPGRAGLTYAASRVAVTGSTVTLFFDAPPIRADRLTVNLCDAADTPEEPSPPHLFGTCRRHGTPLAFATDGQGNTPHTSVQASDVVKNPSRQKWATAV